MALESGTYIDSLNASNPVATDGLAQADDHMRLIKSTILASFPSITGAVNATHTEINTVADGNTTAATSTTLVDADRVPVNDDGTMVQVAMSRFQNLHELKHHDHQWSRPMLQQMVPQVSSDSLMVQELCHSTHVLHFHSGMIMPYAGTTAPQDGCSVTDRQSAEQLYADAVYSFWWHKHLRWETVIDYLQCSTQFEVVSLQVKMTWVSDQH